MAMLNPLFFGIGCGLLVMAIVRLIFGGPAPDTFYWIAAIIGALMIVAFNPLSWRPTQ